jgi:hypothetical protein
VALVGTDVSEERRASFIRVTRIGELRTLAVIGTEARSVLRLFVVLRFQILATVMMETIHFSETPVLTRADKKQTHSLLFDTTRT